MSVSVTIHPIVAVILIAVVAVLYWKRRCA